MKIVKFSDGKYGVRKWTLFGYEYLDLLQPVFWWGLDSTFFGYCHGTLQAAEKAAARFDKGTPV